MKLDYNLVLCLDFARAVIGGRRRSFHFSKDEPFLRNHSSKIKILIMFLYLHQDIRQFQVGSLTGAVAS